LSDKEWLKDLKFKASYGQSGNLPSDSYNLEYMSTYAQSGYGYINGQYLPVYSPARNANPNLKWEKQSSINTGFEFSLLNGRYSGSIEYYYNKTTNLLYSYSVPSPPYVYTRTYANVGSMRNTGIDFQFSGNFVSTRDIGYVVDIIASLNRNKVLSISNEDFTIASGYIEAGDVWGDGAPGNSQRIEPGYPMGSFYMYKYAGLTSEGKYLFYNKEGKAVTTDEITSDDRQYIGKQATPPYQLGLNNSFRYKNWNLNIFLNGQFGNSIVNGTYWHFANLGRLPSRSIPKDFISKGITQNDTYLSSLWVEDGSFMRLQNMTLTYNWKLSPQLSEYIKSLRMSVSAENLFVITRYTGVDPEVPQDDVFNSLGIDNGDYYPKTRNFTFNLYVSF